MRATSPPSRQTFSQKMTKSPNMRGSEGKLTPMPILVCARFIEKHKNGERIPSINIIPCEINDLLEVVEEALFWFDRKI